MKRIIDILQSEYSSEYLQNPKVLKYTKPKIYPKIATTKSPSSFSNKEKKEIMEKYKRWYIYFNYIHPETNKLTRQPSIFFNINRKFKDFDSRLHHIRIVRNSIEKLLKNGYSPYQTESNIKLFSAHIALNYALSLKKSSLKITSYKDYESRISQFKKYLTRKGLAKTPIINIDKNIINNYLNIILKKTSPRNRNNTRSVLSSIFTTLEDNDLIDRNFIYNIKPLKTNPERNKTYNLQKVEEIYSYLNQHNKQLLLYIKFVSYNFLRPIEVCRLQVKDIDLVNNHIHIHAKNKSNKTKIIPVILIKDLTALQLDEFLPTDYIFTPKGPGQWNTSEINKRNYFTKNYKKVKKELDLTADYTVYSFRHTFITKLYRELRAKYTKSVTEDKLMLITGHNTLIALQQYLRDIDAELPEDYSSLLE